MTQNRIGSIKKHLLFILTVPFFIISCDSTKKFGNQLRDDFITPPDDAKPLVWWHWMNGNITKDGIRKDLEWMDRVGIGGFHNFDAGLTTPQVVEKRLIYMTPEWKEALEYTVVLADSLSLEMAIASSPGWSESGGPWVKPEEGMKKYVWSEIRVEGGKQFSGILPSPPSVTGTFQNLGRDGAGFGSASEVISNLPQFYADAAVIALRFPEGHQHIRDLNPIVTSSGGHFTLDELTDGDIDKTTLLPAAPPGRNSWIQFAFSKPETIQSITIATSGNRVGFGSGSNANTTTLEVSDDGKTFRNVIDITSGRAAQTTLSFTPVKGKYFRYNTLTPKSSGKEEDGDMSGFGIFGAQEVAKGTEIAELVLHTGVRVNRFEDKAGFEAVTATILESFPTPDTEDVVKVEDLIDLTSLMRPDGSLEWAVPDGNWGILRIGYSLTGQENRPASPEATGLEVDKLNPSYVRNYFNNYLDQYLDATNGLMGNRGLKYIITDSWEAGSQNWTDNIMVEFMNRRGYNMTQWLPVLAGYVVESADKSDRFLWDFRRTLEEMVAEYHYDELTNILQERGMMGRYSESHEGGRAFIGDGMEVKRKSAIPMSATWTPGGFGGSGPGVATRFKADVRESASVSHIYGQRYVAAESLTAMFTDWAWSPQQLKPVADMELASGLNRFVIHTSVHQPDDRKPGISLGPFGQWFTRHETWAEQAIAWTTYLARSSYMMQQGKFVADVAYLYGEGNNITALFGQQLPDIPEGYEFDFINADALVNVIDVDDGTIITPAGTHYKILALDPSTRNMTLPVLRKIKKMVEAGAVVCGGKPEKTPSLSDEPAEFAVIVNELWANEQGVNNIGNGKIYAGYSIQQVLDMENIAPDFTYAKPEPDTEVLYVHRTLEDGDFYWVNNRNDRVEHIEATFRVKGKVPEIWHPETGLIEPASYTIANGVTTVPLRLEPNDAVFIVFLENTNKITRTIKEKQEEVIFTAKGPWKVQFQEGRGAPAEVIFESLSPWNESDNKGVKYFSGTGTYLKTVEASSDWFHENAQLWLDLGEVENLSEVIVNDKSLGIVWKKPFRINVTNSLKEGANNFEIKVTNLWVNRLIGDRQPDAKNEITFTTSKPYNAETPLMLSGLMGPVRLLKTIE